MVNALAPHLAPTICTGLGRTTFTNNYTTINILLAPIAWMTQEGRDDRQCKEIHPMTLDRVIPLTAAVLLLAMPVAGQTAPQSAKRQPTPAAPGPKVHASKSKDITDCTARTQGGPRTIAGLGLGTLAGLKAGGGATGIVAGAAVAGTVGDALDRKARCGPKADIESNAAADEAPKKKKFSLGGLLGQ